MKVEVHMKNGRTTFRFAKRAHLLDAIRRNQEKTFEGGRIIADVSHHPDSKVWEKASVRAINPSAISFVLELPAATEVRDGVADYLDHLLIAALDRAVRALQRTLKRMECPICGNPTNGSGVHNGWCEGHGLGARELEQ